MIARGDIKTVAGLVYVMIPVFFHEGGEAWMPAIAPVSVDTFATLDLVFAAFCSVRRIGVDGRHPDRGRAAHEAPGLRLFGDGGPATGARLA